MSLSISSTGQFNRYSKKQYSQAPSFASNKGGFLKTKLALSALLGAGPVMASDTNLVANTQSVITNKPAIVAAASVVDPEEKRPILSFLNTVGDTLKMQATNCEEYTPYKVLTATDLKAADWTQVGEVFVEDSGQVAFDVLKNGAKKLFVKLVKLEF